MALIASLLMVYSGIIPEKKKILFVEIIEIGLFALSDYILGGIYGTIVNLISIIINYLCYKDKLNLNARIIITIVTVLIILNNLSPLGIVLCFTMLIYLWRMNVKNIKYFKFLMIFYMTVWMIYDYSIKLYSSVLFDFLTIIMNIISIIKLNKKTEIKLQVKHVG